MKCGECPVATTNPKDKTDCYFCPFDKVDAFHSLHDCSHLSELVEKMAELLKEQDKLLRKKQKDINKLCCDIADLKHRFHEKTEIIRCKDCRWQECEGREGRIVCGEDGSSHAPDWYCADGERAE